MTVIRREAVRGVLRSDRNAPARTESVWLNALAVLALIGCGLALFWVVIVPRVQGTSGQRLGASQVASIAQQVQLWMADNGHSSLPESFTLGDLATGTSAYLAPEHLIDPWDRAYMLINPGDANPALFDVLSYGRDGRRGGEGEDADIVN